MPQLDEGYDCVVIFATRDSEIGWLEKELDLPIRRDRSRVGVSRVLTVPEFRRRWESRSSS